MSALLCALTDCTTLENATLLRHASAAAMKSCNWLGVLLLMPVDSFRQAACYAHVSLMFTITAKILQNNMLAGSCSKSCYQMEQ